MARVHYARDVDPTDINNAHTLAGLLVPAGTRVLDVGAGVGAVARFLAGRGCQVWAIEIDREAARQAERWCVRVVNADLETLDVDAEFGDACFDTILCLDVLEHLKDPVGALRRVLRRLAPGGQVVISLPNVTHASVRLQLLQGRFPRTDAGLLDRTHLQFYDRTAALQLVAEAGLRIVQDLRVVKRPEETELPSEIGRLGEDAIDAATDGPDAHTYQFVFAAVPEADAFTVEAPSLSSILQQRLHEQLALSVETSRWTRELELRLAELQDEAAGLRQEVARAEAHRQAAVADAAIAREQAEQAAAARALLDGRIDELLRRLESAATRAGEVAALQARAERAEQAEAAAAAELAYDRRVADVNQQRQAQLDRRTHDLTVALVVRDQEIARLHAAVADAQRGHADLARQVTFLQHDRMVRDAFVSDLKQRLLDAAAECAGARERREQLEIELAAAERALHERLAEPRYVVADRINAALKRVGVVHRVLKAWLPARRPAGRP
jgi:2-polyprenyl-3-methyl-5-hydroxy-6-metoxy-1,4-benzoquinol methylase